jgi:antitoxin MazE
MQVAKWGNSLAIRLPLALVKKLNLSEGDEVRLRFCGPKTSTSST